MAVFVRYLYLCGVIWCVCVVFGICLVCVLWCHMVGGEGWVYEHDKVPVLNATSHEF